MNYQEVFDLMNAHGAKQVYDFLKEHPDQKPAGIDELLLAAATASYSAEYRKKYKALIAQIGGDAAKQALKLVSKRNYNQSTGTKNMLADLPELEQIPGFNGPQFAKAIQAVGIGFRGGREYFLEHATDEEIKHYFINEIGDKDGTISLWPGNDLSPRVAQLMWDVIPKLAPRLTRIVCRTKGTIRINIDRIRMPKLTGLTLEAELDQFPLFVFDQPSLRQLSILSNLSVFPEGISQLVNLEELGVSMPLRELPGDFFWLPKLKELKLLHTRLSELPEAIGTLTNLKALSFYANTGLKTLPESVFALPNLSDFYRKNLLAEFRPSNEYETLHNALGYVIRRSFLGLPDVAALYAKYQANEEPNYFPELIMAATKAYWDDEHGRSLGTYFKDIDRDAPEKLRAVNKALKPFKYIDDTTTPEDFDKMRKKLEAHPWFDAEKFISLAQLMAASVYAEYPFKKW